MLTAAQILNYTDRLAGQYDILTTAQTSLLVKMTALMMTLYGDGTGANPSLGDPTAQDSLGPATRSAAAKVAAGSLASTALGSLVSRLSDYLKNNAPANAPSSVRDLVSCLRYYNGCPDPSPAANGANSSYANLLHPDFAALFAVLTGGSITLPPDIVFAPAGLVLLSYDIASQTPAYGGTLLYAPPAAFSARFGGPLDGMGDAPLDGMEGQANRPGYSYAPTRLLDALAGATPPNGSLKVTVTATNQNGASVTFKGDIGTGNTPAGHLLVQPLSGTEGGASGGTAGPTDLIVSLSGITVDPSSTATSGSVSLVTHALRGTL